jgi:uncharacterized protein (TIGR02145 family)
MKTITNRAELLEAVKKDGRALQYAGEALKNDREIVLEAVKQNGEALRYAGEDLKNDREIVLEAVKQHRWALQYAGAELKNDRDIVLEAVKFTFGIAFQDAGAEFKNDREIVLEAVKQEGSALEYAGAEFKNDREIVLEAVKQHGMALEYASEALKNDRDIVLEAVKFNGYALKNAGEALKNDREIVLEAFNHSKEALKYAGKEFQNDQDIIKIFNIENREIVLEAVKKDGRALKYASDKFIIDREIVLEAVKQNGSALKYAGAEFKNDREFVLEAVKQSGIALQYAGEALKNDREIVLEAVKQDGRALQFAAKVLRKDTDIIRKAQHSFKTISIGKQEWLDRNLAVDTFRNGDAIPEAKTKTAWLKAGKEGKPAWCFYNNDPSNETKYGKLYNWYAVNDPRGLAPEGYQVASDKDWQVLKIFLDDDDKLGAGNKLKSQVGWDNPPKRRYSYSKVHDGQGFYINLDGGNSQYKNFFCNLDINTDGNGLDEFGFKALPGGIYQSSFEEAGNKGFWWSKSELVIAYSMNNEDGEPIEIPKVNGYIPAGFYPPFSTSQLCLIDDQTKDLNKIKIDKTNGLSVRCVKV